MPDARTACPGPLTCPVVCPCRLFSNYVEFNFFISNTSSNYSFSGGTGECGNAEKSDEFDLDDSDALLDVPSKLNGTSLLEKQSESTEGNKRPMGKCKMPIKFNDYIMN